MEKNELELKVSECTDIESLVRLLNETETISGSRTEFTGESMARRAISVFRGYDMPRYVTRSHGIRKKVMVLAGYPEDIINFYCRPEE